MSKFIEIPLNTKFGKWTVISNAGRKGHSHMWLCQCDCGKLCEVNGYTLRNKRSIRCQSCKLRDILNTPEAKIKREKRLADRNKNGEAAINQVFSGYKHSAIKRNRVFELTKEQFVAICISNCHYCNRPPHMTNYSINKTHTAFVRNGIDRKDNNLGYTLKNSLPCCSVCNKAKLNMSYDEFIAWIHQAHHHLVGDTNAIS